MQVHEIFLLENGCFQFEKRTLNIAPKITFFFPPASPPSLHSTTSECTHYQIIELIEKQIEK